MTNLLPVQASPIILPLFDLVFKGQGQGQTNVMMDKKVMVRTIFGEKQRKRKKKKTD